MRVLILGQAGEGSLLDAYTRAFENLGAQVATHDYLATYAAATPGAGTRVGRKLLHPVSASRMNTRILAELEDAEADLVLVLKGQFLRPSTIAALRERTGAPIVNFYPDDPWWKHVSTTPTYGHRMFAEYDVCFTYGLHHAHRYREAGARQVELLHFARDAGLHSPPVDRPEPDFDIVFVGNLDPTRVRWLEAVADRRIAIMGSRTYREMPRRSPLRRGSVEVLPGVPSRGLAAAFARGRISLNVMRDQAVDAHNMRSFESLASGAFTLSQRTPQLEEMFRSNQEVVFFSTPDELRERVDEWLARPDADRRRVAEAGFRRVEHDTYERRAETILEVTGLPVRARESSEPLPAAGAR